MGMYPYLSSGGPSCIPSAGVATLLVPQADQDARQYSPRRPGGLAEGAVFLAGKPRLDPITGSFLFSDRGYEDEALRYIRPLPIEDLALFGGLGLCKPHGAEWLFQANDVVKVEILGEAARQRRPVTWLFRASERNKCEIGSLAYRGDEAGHQERQAWKLFRVSEGVWAALYLP